MESSSVLVIGVTCPKRVVDTTKENALIEKKFSKGIQSSKKITRKRKGGEN
jgi:hypothetical protein